MDNDSKSDVAGDPRTYLAAERTLLAWVRTGLAMMGFGFVVARFGLFLREMAAVRNIPSQQRLGVSLLIGTTLVLFGVAVTVGAAVRHWRIVERLEKGWPIRPRRFSLATIVALLLGLLGLCIAGYLLFGLNDAQ